MNGVTWQKIRKAEYHRDDCIKPGPRMLPLREDHLAHCPGCGARWIVAASEPLPPPVVATSYVCRDHYEPVTWRGRGCRSCRAAAARGAR